MDLLFYRLLLTLLAPLLLWRGMAGAGAFRWERLGFVTGHKGAIWIHAASNGEATAVRPLIDALLAGDPKTRIHVTTNSVTGRALVTSWGLPRVSASLAPLDFRWCLGAFLPRIAPRALVLVENELWPNRQRKAAKAKVPVIIVSARISQKSADFWARFPSLAKVLLAPVRLVSPQDEGSAKRFHGLGVPASAISAILPLKSVGRTAVPNTADRSNVVLAASTHEGEDTIILRAFAQARRDRPDLRLIIAPRHPKRSTEVADLIRDAGFDFAKRSDGAEWGDTPVFLADTLGEMDRWYAMAGVVFVGGSLVDKGGHTPYEPAAHACAIIHGPHLDNFAAEYAGLQAAGGSILVQTTDDLARALAATDAVAARKLADAARTALTDTDAEAGLVRLASDILTLCTPSDRS